MSCSVVPYNIYIKKRILARPSHGHSETLIKSIDHSRIKPIHAHELIKSSQKQRTLQPKRRSSMEEVELISFEIDMFLDNMKSQYIQYRADQLPTLGGNTNKQNKPTNSSKTLGNNRNTIDMGMDDGTTSGTTTTNAFISIEAKSQFNAFCSNVLDPLEEFRHFMGKRREELVKRPITDDLVLRKQASLLNNGNINNNTSNKSNCADTMRPFTAPAPTTSTNVYSMKPRVNFSMLDSLTSTIVNARSIF
jgi:hypothetical protein